MKNALNDLTTEQIDFICKECSITKEGLFTMDDDSLYERVYDVMCDIEIDEVCSSETGEDTERCTLASDIVTVLGNALAEEEGFFEQQEFYDE